MLDLNFVSFICYLWCKAASCQLYINEYSIIFYRPTDFRQPGSQWTVGVTYRFLSTFSIF